MKTLISAGVLLILAGSLAARAPVVSCLRAPSRAPGGAHPLGDAGRIRSLADRDLPTGAAGAKTTRWARSISSPPAKRRAAAALVKDGITVSLAAERRHRERRRRAVPGGMGDDVRDPDRRDRPHRLSLHPRRRRDPHRLVRAHLLQRQGVERLSGLVGGHERGRRRQELGPQHEERHRHAGGALRHPAAQGRAVSRTGHPDLPRGSRGVGEEGRRQDRRRRRAAAALGPLGAARQARAVADRPGLGRARQHRHPLAQEAGRLVDRMGDARLRRRSRRAICRGSRCTTSC